MSKSATFQKGMMLSVNFSASYIWLVEGTSHNPWRIKWELTPVSGKNRLARSCGWSISSATAKISDVHDHHICDLARPPNDIALGYTRKTYCD